MGKQMLNQKTLFSLIFICFPVFVLHIISLHMVVPFHKYKMLLIIAVLRQLSADHGHKKNLAQDRGCGGRGS